MVDSKTIDEMIIKLNALLENNKTENGEYRLNLTRTAVALDFAKHEIEKAILEYQE